MKETTLERQCRGIAHEHGALFLKMNPAGVAGVPDRVLLLPGGLVRWVEFKTPFGTVSKIQEIVHAEFAKRGHPVHVVRTTAEFRRLCVAPAPVPAARR